MPGIAIYARCRAGHNQPDIAADDGVSRARIFEINIGKRGNHITGCLLGRTEYRYGVVDGSRRPYGPTKHTFRSASRRDTSPPAWQ